MGGKKKQHNRAAQPAQNGAPDSSQLEEKRFVNLLHVYTIYKQKFRRLKKEEFKELLCAKTDKRKNAAVKLCNEFMKAKEIPHEIEFKRNVGFLSVPRLLPLVALLAERSEYNFIPVTVRRLDFSSTPDRFRKKFAPLMVYGFWFLGRVISDSLSVKDQVNRGNMFNFSKGDLGFWWAGVKILDWNNHANKEKEPVSCFSFVKYDPRQYRFYSERAIVNMNSHPAYFLSDEDWFIYLSTVNLIRHARVYNVSDTSDGSCCDESCSSEWTDTSESDVSSLSSEDSINTLASRESVD